MTVNSLHCRDLMYSNQGNQALLALIADKKGGIALDCGCGAGDNAKILKSRGWRVTGITISEKEKEVASQHCESVYLFDLNQGLPSEAGSGYDLVLMSHVLEHLENPSRLLQCAKNALTPAGIVAVALPNVVHYRQRIKFLLGRFDYGDGGIMDVTHLRFFTFISGQSLLRESGFSVKKAEVDGSFPLWKLRKICPKKMDQFLNRFICSIVPNLIGSQSLYIASADKWRQSISCR